MGTLTINSEAFPGAEPIFLPLDITFTGQATTLKQFVRFTDLLGPGTGNVQNYDLPPGISIVQPPCWNQQNFTNTPDEYEVNSIVLNLGTGATGTLFYTENDGITVPSLPYTVPIGPGPLNQVLFVGIDNYTSGTTVTEVVVNVTLRDTISGDNTTEDVYIRFVNEPAEIQLVEDISDECQSSKTFDIVVPAGTTKHISTIRTSVAATPLIDENLSSTKQYTLSIEGDNTPPLTNTDTITLYVRNGGPTGPIEDTISLTRQHNGSLCVP